MNQSISETLREDIHEIISDPNIPWNEMHRRTILVTGATGLIGGLLVRAISTANSDLNLGVKLIAHGRDSSKGRKLVSEFDIEFISGDIRRPLPSESLPQSIDYIFHCAAITKSAEMASKPVDVISTEIEGTKNILNIALDHQSRSFVYLSSMEIYGQTNKDIVHESDMGYLDLTNPRSCYPESKRLCETMCLAYAIQHGVPVKIARPALTFGAGVPNDDSNTRVANQFARKALRNEDIELHTLGNSVTNCCYTADVIRGLMTILLKGKTSDAYNISNQKTSTTIRKMAELVASDICKGDIHVVTKIPANIETLGYAPDVGHSISSAKLQSLGWSPKYGLEEMYNRMIADWR